MSMTTNVTCRGPQVKKTSRRDLAFVMAHKLDGATTVSSTMFLAAKVGIGVFVTGGMHGYYSQLQGSVGEWMH